jgi:hypothetical protein
MSRIPSGAQILLALVAGHIIFAGMVLVLPMNRVAELAAIIVLSISLGVLRSFWPVIWGAVKGRAFASSDLLALGAFCKSLALAVLTGWIVAYASRFDQLPSVRESPIFAWALFVAGFGGILYMLSEGALPGYIPRHEWIRSGAWIGLGVLVFGALMMWAI